MTKPQLLAPTLVALALLATSPGLAAPAPSPIMLRLIAFNDFHGNLEEANLSLPWPATATTPTIIKLPAGGAAALAGLVRSLRQGVPHSLVISSGDLFGATPLISSLLRHEPSIAIANQIGVDLASPGNHEFDAGRDDYLRLLQGRCAPPEANSPLKSCALGPILPARFQTIAANIATTANRTLFPATSIREIGGVKVGFIGAVTQTIPTLVIPSAIRGLRFGEEVDSLNQAAAELQRQGVEAIVAVVHEGGEIGMPGQPLQWNTTTCPNARGQIFDIARQLSPAIDVVFSAHTHQGYNCLLDGRPVMQATAFGRGVSVVDLALNPHTRDVDRTRTISRNLPVLNGRSEPALRQAVLAAEPMPWRAVLERATTDRHVANRVAAYARVVAPLAQRQVGWIAGSFERDGLTDSTAGRLVADAQLAATRTPATGGAQAALVNPGGIRADLPCRSTPPCPITYGDIVAMQPFDDPLIVLSLSGSQLKELLESQQPPERAQPIFLIPSASLRYSWRVNAPFGQRVQSLLLNGRPIEPDQNVRLVVNSFLAQGGDGFALFLQGRDSVGGPLDVQALEDVLQGNPTPDPQPRITLVE